MNKQNEILNYLLEGGTLTVQKAFSMFHTTELRKVICRIKGDLLSRGYNLESEYCDGLREGERYKEYWAKKIPVLTMSDGMQATG